MFSSSRLCLGLLVGSFPLLVFGCATNKAVDGATTPPDDVDASVVPAPPDAPDASVNELVNKGVTTLRVHYPVGDRSIAVRGDQGTLDWDHGVSMKKADGDTFEYTLTLPKSVTRLEWKPLLDDSTWSRGPNYVALRGQTVDVYPHFTTVQGAVSSLIADFHSTTLSNDRAIWAYLPPSYAENTVARFPVIYMHDGDKLFDPQPRLGTNGWRVDATLDAAAEDGSIAEVIVIGISVTDANRDYELTPTFDSSRGDGGGGGLYLKMIALELKPQIDKLLRTKPERSNTAVVGSSFGGLISAYAGAHQGETFGLVGALSPSTWWDDRMLINEVAKSASPRPERVYVDNGGVADGKADTDDLVKAYGKIGYVKGKTLEYEVTSAAHDEKAWAARFPGAMRFLIGPRQR